MNGEKTLTVSNGQKLTAQKIYAHGITGKALLNKEFNEPVYNSQNDELVKIDGNKLVFRTAEIDIGASKPPIKVSGKVYNLLTEILLAKEPPKFIRLDDGIIATRSIRSVLPLIYSVERGEKELFEDLKGYIEVKNIEDL